MSNNPPIILGIDLGAKSVGWAVLACAVYSDGQPSPIKVLDAGSRIFEAGVEGNIDQGKDQSRSVDRRMQRGTRRQLYRRAQRIRNTLRALCTHGFLTDAIASPPQVRHDYLLALDNELIAVLIAEGEDESRVHDTPIYQMRRRCLSGKRSIREIGRAFFHLAQRRGFKSNRKDTSKDNEKGVVKSGIKDLVSKIASHDFTTLGEYFSSLNPHEINDRIRGRWTSRAMYEEEFNEIWKAQSPHYPEIMTDKSKAAIHRAIFFQRPLKSSSHLIGFCELEPQKRRAPLGCLIYQRFRIVDKINTLNWRDENGVLCGPLHVDDPRRQTLINRLDNEGDLTMTEAKKVLGLHKKAAFMLEEGAAKTLPGNRTAAKLQPLIPNHWDSWSPSQRDQFVNELISDIEQSKWEKRLVEYWKLSEEEAERVADVGLQEGYASLSRRAMRRVLVEMEAGVPYATARKKLYPHRNKGLVAMDKLPGVLTPASKRYLGKINNPAVVRALTELRKVVNAIINKYGKPVRIRIELARDLRNSRKQRQDMTDNIKERTAIREEYTNKLKTLRNIFGGREPSRSDVEKWSLAEECNWVCPYTGKPFDAELLFGKNRQFDVEHIIPRSRRPDDSYGNKTICYVEENKTKGNQTPYEAYHNSPKWDEIQNRVKKFNGHAARGKLRLFQTDKIDEDFTNRDLNDTRYASRLAKDYLGLLYGGADGIDDAGTRRIQACCGGINATLRNEWGFNTILGTDGEKNRQDHRHHAVDAIVIGLASPQTVQMLSVAARQAEKEGRRRYARLNEPWADFRGNVTETIDKVIVSHRVNHSLSGALHQGTNYSPLKKMVNKNGKLSDVRHIREKLVGITPPKIEKIIDPRVKKAVIDFLAGRDPKKVFKKDSIDWPVLPSKKNKVTIIRKVRIGETTSAVSIGSNGQARYVAAGENNHLEIVASTDKKGIERWDISAVVSRYEANRRLSAGEPVIRKNWEEGKELIMVLRRGDYLELDIAGARRIMRVTSIGSGEIQTRPHDFGAPEMEKSDRNSWRFQSGNSFQATNPKKITVSPIGEVRISRE